MPPAPKTRRRTRIAVLAAGWGFVALGVAGLFLPILQGALFLLVGLYLLSRELPWARRLRQALRQRYPKLAETMDQARDKAKATLRRLVGRRAG